MTRNTTMTQTILIRDMKAERIRQPFEAATYIPFGTYAEAKAFVEAKTAACWKNPKMLVDGQGTNWKRYSAAQESVS